jgi:methyltransferase
MGVTQIAYLALLALVGAQRLMELVISRAHHRRMVASGASVVREKYFPAMVLLHAGVLVAAGAEVIFLHRPFIPALAISMFILFLLSNAMRGWVIATMRDHWTAQVMNSVDLGVVHAGPYRWIRHPNYVAVFVEIIALPLIYSAWITAIAATALNLWVLRQRLRVEDSLLLANPNYRELMGGKPRFIPRFL